MSKIVNVTAHKVHHIVLHRELDELIADFITHTKKGLDEITLLELVKWSHQQTISPTEDDED